MQNFTLITNLISTFMIYGLFDVLFLIRWAFFFLFYLILLLLQTWCPAEVWIVHTGDSWLLPDRRPCLAEVPVPVSSASCDNDWDVHAKDVRELATDEHSTTIE